MSVERLPLCAVTRSGVEFQPHVVCVQTLGAAGNQTSLLEVTKMEYYKGYVPTNGKIPKIKFKNREDLYTFDQVKNLPEYAGILEDNMIVIDVDEAQQAETLLRIVNDFNIDCVVRRTSRGMHFLFENSGAESCKAGSKLACGLTADIKVGKHNCTQQIKIAGKEREIIHNCEHVQALPKWLFPVKTRC